MSNEIDSESKRHLESFIVSYYDVEPEEAERLVNMDKIPKDIRDLEFAENKLIYSNDETVGELSEEFFARTKNLRDIIKLNISNPPSFRDGYIEQFELSPEAHRKARENPNLVTESLLTDKEFNDLIQRIQDEVDYMIEELDNCELSESLRSQFQVVFALINYAIDLENTAQISNSYRVLKYLTAHKNISKGRHKHAYSKLGHKLDVIFDDENLIPDELYPYYNGNISELVDTVDKALEQRDD